MQVGQYGAKMSDKKIYDIVDKYGLPREEISCPACGNIYGRYNRKVCVNCQECSKCCSCKKPKMIDADTFIKELEI